MTGLTLTELSQSLGGDAVETAKILGGLIEKGFMEHNLENDTYQVPEELAKALEVEMAWQEAKAKMPPLPSKRELVGIMCLLACAILGLGILALNLLLG